MDGLPMEEHSGVEYASTGNAAHMCGHDGHMTILIGFAEVVMKLRDRIPSTCTVILLWQPAEEG